MKCLDQRKSHWLIWLAIIVAFVIGLCLPSPWIEREIHYFSRKGIWVKDTVGMLLPGGNVYEGTVSMLDGKPLGYGVMKGRNATYIGKWTDGRLVNGVCTDSISTYEGGFNKEFERNGFGLLRFTPEYVRKLMAEGRNAGTIVEEYAGNWLNNRMNGLGRTMRADSTMSFGYYRNNIFQVVKGADYAPGNKIYGIDVSHYQRKIDWDNLALYGDSAGMVSGKKIPDDKYLQPVLFVFVKCTDGTRLKDGMFMYNMTMARKHGIKRGAYHFFRAEENIQGQITNFTNNTVWMQGDLPPVLDMEVYKEITTLGKQVYLSRALEWLKGVEKVLGIKPIVYTSENIYNHIVKNDRRFEEYKFWIAKYSKVPPSLPTWEFWQFTGSGNAQGVVGIVDIDLYRSNYKDFINTYRENR